jgi:tetratricopeptide (TPR) repeat protein
MAQKVLANQTDTIASTADAARAHFILARVDLMTGHPDEAVDDFQKTLATSKDQRLLAWSHIYLGRMLDLECKRDEALAEYKAGYAARDGQLDTRLAAERGMKAAYVQRGHEHDCDEDAGDDAPGRSPATGPAGLSPQTQGAKPNPQ